MAHSQQHQHQQHHDPPRRLRYPPGRPGPRLTTKRQSLHQTQHDSPQLVLANQQEFLRFSFETIYEGLNEVARQLLTVMHAAGRRLDTAELSFLTELEPDDIRRALHDLSRRSLVTTRLTGPDQTREVFGLSSSTALYLTSRDRDTSGLVATVNHKEKQLRETHEQLVLAARRNPLSPNVVDDLNGDSAPVAHLLSNALRLSRGTKQREKAAQLLDQAQRLAPDMYEVYRVRGMLLSRSQPDLAAEAYDQALELARSDQGRARVAYFYAEHNATVLRDMPRAEALADQAHRHFGLPVTAARLGRVLTFQCRWDDAERLLRLGLTDEDVRAALIARTQLVDLVRRRVEALASDERLPDRAVTYGAGVLKETMAYLATGRVDEQLLDQALRLAIEILRSARRSADLGKLELDLLYTVDVLRDGRGQLATSQHRHYAISHLEELTRREDASSKVRTNAQECLREIGALLTGPVKIGRVKKLMRAKGFGFLIDEAGQDLFFHWTAVPDPNAQIQLIEGTVVQYVRGTGNDGRSVAEWLGPTHELNSNVLRARRAEVKDLREGFAIAQDHETEVSVLIHHTVFPSRDTFPALEVGDLIRVDYELADRGPRAAKGSGVVVRSAPSGNRKLL